MGKVNLINVDDAARYSWAKKKKTKLKSNRTKFIPSSFLNHPEGGIPRLTILILIVGSRGDVQPFISLGKELLKDGHHVRIGTHENFRDFVHGNGLSFYPIGGDPAELMAYMVKNPGLAPSMESIVAGDISRKRKMISEILEGCWRACINSDEETGEPFECDAIISNPVTFAHIHCAERLSVPVHIFFTMPWSPTKSYAHPLSNMSSQSDSLRNELSYTLVDSLTWNGLADLINEFRSSTLLLEPIPVSSFAGSQLLSTMKIPHTYCWSPSLIPKPRDWGEHIDICGFFFLDLAMNFTPDPTLQDFLRAGPPPVYIGFGSIVVEDKGKVVQTILEALRLIPGVRAIVSKGWGELDLGDAPPNVYLIGDCPHDWLFTKVSAVVCHGGAGTTAAALRCGKPVFVIPFFGDQKFWGSMIARAGAGPLPIHHKKLNSKNLSEGISFCLELKTEEAAQELGRKIQQENGLQEGVRSFYRHLPFDAMRCDVDWNQTATLYIRRKEIKLCAKEADRLVKAKVLRASDLRSARRWRAKSFSIQEICAPSGVVSGAIRGGSDGMLRALEGFSELLIQPAKGRDISTVARGLSKGLLYSCAKLGDSVFVAFHETTVGVWNGPEYVFQYHNKNAFAVESFGQGCTSGLYYLVAGVVLASMDIFVLPVAGAKRNGFVGFCRGFSASLLSVTSRPIAGFALCALLPEKGFKRGLQIKKSSKVEYVYVPK